MKEENEELRNENQILRERVARLEQERDEFTGKDKKRAYDDTSTSPGFPPADSARKRPRADENKQEARPPVPLPSFPSPSSPPVSSPHVTAPAGFFSPGGHDPPPDFSTPPPINDLLSFTTTNETTGPLDGQDPVSPYSCILCSPDAPCVCREVSVQRATSITNNSLNQLALQSESINQQSFVSLDQSVHVNTPPSADMSILDNLPSFQAPVPIRRRTGTPRANVLFPVTPIATTSSASKCSGDPENCMACADDTFGKAFCQAIDHSVNSTLPCIDCPKRTNQTDEILVGGCCGDISKCGSCGIAPIISSTTPLRGPETIPTDDAWRQLKSHPNVAFADLTLLAEVVARRSKCTGSRVVISPALDSATPDHNAQLSHHEPTATSEDQSVLLTDPHEHFRQRQVQRELPPQLVPQHILIECGRRRVREVNADGVKEALRLLDQKFAHMR